MIYWLVQNIDVWMFYSLIFLISVLLISCIRFIAFRFDDFEDGILVEVAISLGTGFICGIGIWALAGIIIGLIASFTETFHLPNIIPIWMQWWSCK